MSEMRYANKSQTTVNRRYIRYIYKDSCGAYIINGCIGRQVFFDYTKQEAIRLYNQKARNQLGK